MNRPLSSIASQSINSRTSNRDRTSARRSIMTIPPYRLPVDGSDDSSIHCLKPGGVAHSALETITEGTASLNNSYEWDEEDPFTDCDTELEDDETLIDDE